RYLRNKSNVARVNTNSRDNANKTDDRIDKLADQISNLVEIVNKQIVTPAKAVEKTCVTYEHNTEKILDKEQSNSSGSIAQVKLLVVPILILEPDVLRSQTKPTISYPSSFVDALLLMPKFALTIKSLLANKDKLFELAKVPSNENCLAMLLKKLPEKLGDPGKFLIPCDFPRMEVCHALADLGASINLMPLSIWKKLSLPKLTPTQMTLELADRLITHPKGVIEDVFVKVGKFHFPTEFIVVDFNADPRIPLILGRSFLRISRALIDVYGEEITIKVHIVKSSSPTLTSFRESDFLLAEIKDFLNDDSIPTRIENSVYDLEGDILFLEKLLNEDPFQLPPMDLKLAKDSKEKSSVEELPELELKEYRLILKTLKYVLKSHKWAIAWKISDIKGIDPRFCTHKILMMDDYKPAIQSQRRVNPKIHDVIKKEVIKLFDAGMIYPICDSPWVSPIHCVPKKGGMTIVANENNELIPMRLVTGWRVCIDYRKLNDATRKDHFLLPFMDQMLEREGIILGHKISKSSIEVDRAKVDVIAKLLHPTTVNGVRCFLGHAGFYNHFIQDFSKIARPMTHLLEKETPFVFSKECVDAFNNLKKKLTEPLILVIPDWNLPFELMCDASDYAIGVVLGQRKSKYFQPIRYGIDCMGPFPSSKVNKYILIAIDYLSKWVEAKSLPTNDSWVVVKFLKSLFSRFSIPRAIISDRGTHFCNDQFTRVMINYGVTHRLATAYHPRTSGQVKVSNRGLKRILKGRWEKTVPREHRAYWALKHVNFNLKIAGDHRKLRLNDLSELRDQAYENSVIYKERTKKLHESKIKNHIFNVNGHRVKHYFDGDIPSNVALDLHMFPKDN
nr:hypothetical protein [Tanacetum cinerariifolium]